MKTLPKAFSLGAFDYEVQRVKDLGDRYGEHDGANQVIRVEYASRQGANRELVSQTFCHELVHAILFHMGESELYENERFVDGFGQMLYQYMKTKRNR